MRPFRCLLLPALGLIAPVLGTLDNAEAAAKRASGSDGAAMDWRWSNPSPTGNSLIEVAFTDSLRGLAVTEHGEVAESKDGGFEWTLRPGRLDNALLIAATMGRDGSILAVGTEGHLWKAPHGGGAWRMTGTFPGTLYDVRTCGPQTALAVGMGGTILRSPDGGDTWTRVRRDSLGPELLGVHCGEGPLAFAVGRDGMFLRSRNQGVTWDTLPAPSADLLTRVAFADTARGLVTTGEGKVLDTRDGGRTWRESVLDSVTFFRGLDWRGADVTLSGSDGVVWKSRDDGATWTLAETGTPQFISASAHLGSAGGAEVAVGNYGLILRSRDGGATWDTRRIGVTSDIMGLAVVGEGEWVAFGYKGMILKTVDSGGAWAVKDSGTGIHLAGSFHGRRGAISSHGGTMVYSEDAGETWHDAETPEFSGRLFGVAFCDTAAAVAVGDSGTVWRSADGGRSWQALTGIPGLGLETLSAVAFRPDGKGFIVGYQGVILASSDRGSTWERVASPVTDNLYGLDLRDDNTAMAVGAKGTVLFTGDGGKVWERRTVSSPDDQLYGIAWLGGDTALVHGEWGHFVMLRLTTDAGASWSQLPTPGRRLFWTMKGIGPGKAALLGQNGAVMVGTLAAAGTRIRGTLPRALQSGAGFSVHRSGPGLRAVLDLPRPARIRITARSLDGRSLGVVYRGNQPAGLHSLPFRMERKPGPTLFLLEAEDSGFPIRRISLLPY